MTSAGAETLIGEMDHQAKGLAFIGVDLFSVDVGSDLLRKINTIDAATIIGSEVNITLVGETVDGATGLATNPDTGVLWGLLKLDGQSNRELVTIDHTTGIATSIGTTDLNGLAGLAFVPMAMASVPEPGTIALFGLGLAGLGFARRKKA